MKITFLYRGEGEHISFRALTQLFEEQYQDLRPTVILGPELMVKSCWYLQLRDLLYRTLHPISKISGEAESMVEEVLKSGS